LEVWYALLRRKPSERAVHHQVIYPLHKETLRRRYNKPFQGKFPQGLLWKTFYEHTLNMQGTSLCPIFQRFFLIFPSSRHKKVCGTVKNHP
jgi:hypothetical protein